MTCSEDNAWEEAAEEGASEKDYEETAGEAFTEEVKEDETAGEVKEQSESDDEPAEEACETPNEDGEAEYEGEACEEPEAETEEDFGEKPEESVFQTYSCSVSEGVKVGKEIKKGVEDMKLGEMEAAVEAILFAAGEAVEIGSIAAVIGEDKATAESLAESLIIKY
ncbi:MAG: SMC-Scp complex subunit ScpB, partial [Clostridiales bacterium]|nr:SMC-Scp complex subunit ScpB [Clostridiales bacterium]